MHECTWRETEDDGWETDCGSSFSLYDGSPEENNMKFCCYCGGKLTGIQFEYEEPPDMRKEREVK